MTNTYTIRQRTMSGKTQTIEFSGNGYRPESITLDGEQATMELYAERHNGKNWTSTASGNILFYRTASGRECSVRQAAFQNAVTKSSNQGGKTL